MCTIDTRGTIILSKTRSIYVRMEQHSGREDCSLKRELLKKTLQIMQKHRNKNGLHIKFVYIFLTYISKTGVLRAVPSPGSTSSFGTTADSITREQKSEKMEYKQKF